MSAYAREHSIRIHLEGLEGMSAADLGIEMDYQRRSLGFTFEQDACMDWWLWR